MKWSNAVVIILMTGMSMIMFAFLMSNSKEEHNKDAHRIVDTFVHIKFQEKLGGNKWETIALGEKNAYNLTDYQTEQLNRLLKASVETKKENKNENK